MFQHYALSSHALTCALLSLGFQDLRSRGVRPQGPRVLGSEALGYGSQGSKGQKSRGCRSLGSWSLWFWALGSQKVLPGRAVFLGRAGLGPLCLCRIRRKASQTCGGRLSGPPAGTPLLESGSADSSGSGSTTARGAELIDCQVGRITSTHQWNQTCQTFLAAAVQVVLTISSRATSTRESRFQDRDSDWGAE